MANPTNPSDLEGLLEERPEAAPRRWGAARYAALAGLLGLAALALAKAGSLAKLRGATGELLGLESMSDCFKVGMFYTNPHKMMGTERMMEETAVMCQQRCSQVGGCAHFTFWPDGGCLLSGPEATLKATPFQFSEAVTGPPDCRFVEEPEAVSTWGADAALGGVQQAGEKVAEVKEKVAEVAPPSPGVNGTACSAYPACMMMGMNQGDCCPNADKVSLGCCSGFPPPIQQVKMVPGSECSSFPACVMLNVTGACCPTATGTRLGCCGM
ncbi:unnamed protein product [Effrenium voratum]|uniref:Apple domain-containing protein n=1 Tax=Effrenium voratum TaxID=2562239 RepID=A0AA36JGF5_9DINO|nr:unnamed protein product [Effrenium voratum]CAJ1428815.1 unnamed protein product [Effrenium voratum]